MSMIEKLIKALKLASEIESNDKEFIIGAVLDIFSKDELRGVGRDVRSLYPFIIRECVKTDTSIAKLKRLFILFKKLLDKLYESDFTKSVALREIRRSIKKIIGNEVFDKNFSVENDKNRISVVNKTTKDNLESKQQNALKRKLDNPFNTTIDEVKSFILEMFNNECETTNDWAKSLLAIVCATGCRISEIYDKKTSGFKSERDFIIQTGVAKGISKKTNVIIKKPVLFLNPKEVIRRIRKIREDEELHKDKPLNITMNMVSNRCNRQLAKSEFGQKLRNKGYTSYTLRAIYCVVSHEIYAKERTLVSWINEVTGHEKISASDIYYQHIKINNIFDLKPEEEMKIKEELHAGNIVYLEIGPNKSGPKIVTKNIDDE